MVSIIEKISLSCKDFINYLKHKCKNIRIKDFILKLRLKEDNKLSERRTNSSSASKVNVMEQVVRSHNKNIKKQKACCEGKNVDKLNGKCFICNKTWHLSKDCKNKGKQGNSIKKLLKTISLKLITLPMKFHK